MLDFDRLAWRRRREVASLFDTISDVVDWHRDTVVINHKNLVRYHKFPYERTSSEV